MKRRIISIILSVLITASAVQLVFSESGAVSAGEVLSAAPLDKTPAEQDYSPGLGDRNDAVSYTVAMGWLGHPTGLSITNTYEEALQVQRMVANMTNGAHQVVYTIGQDVLRWGSSPYLIEDTSYPMGDGTPGSGYAKYRQYVDDSYKNNADVAQILEPLLAGSMRNDYASPEEVIPLSCYTHDENGEMKVGWRAEGEYWYLLSLYNLYNTGYAQKAWQRMQDTWNFRSHIYYDAMIPVPEGLYNNPNLTTMHGGVITDTEMEWEAVEREIRYSWENYALSSGQEYLHPRYKGLSCSFTLPYGQITDNDYLNTWGNSMVIGTRGNDLQSLVWGSELIDGGYQMNHDGSQEQWDSFLTRLMERNLQYLYMLERRPLEYTNNGAVYQVVFSGDLVSSYDKLTGNYTLIENGDFVIADGTDRFIPQVGAGCKIYAYSRDGGTRTRRLPDSWTGVRAVDVYRLSFDNAPMLYDTLEVTDGCITMNMSAKAPYLVVPQGDSPTPDTAGFNDLSAGDTVGNYKDLTLGGEDSVEFKVYEASANGGFTTPSIYADINTASAVTQIGMAEGAILHSFKVGCKEGEGRIVLHSSNPLNPDVMITLPRDGRVYKFNTDWVYGETASVTVTIENDSGVSNVLIDSVVYTESSKAGACALGEHDFVNHHTDPLCGTEGRDSDRCRYCGYERNITVIPAIEGEHNLTDEELLLTATPYNCGRAARFCLKCSYTEERTIPKITTAQSLAFHHRFGYNYMQADDLYPYKNSDGTVAFDILPLDVSERQNPTGPCYLGVWFGEGYRSVAAYDFSKQAFVIGEGEMRLIESLTEPYATENYSWTRTSRGSYPCHRFEMRLQGDTVTVLLDGVEMLKHKDPSFESAENIPVIYSKGEFLIDNITVTDNGLGQDGAGRVLVTDFENGEESLSAWTLGGYITYDIRAVDVKSFIPDGHVHTNELLLSHGATYFHGSYDEYECSVCHERTVVETGEAVPDDMLVHVSAKEPTCTEGGNTEYWYDRNGIRYSDGGGVCEVSFADVIISPSGHVLTYHPPVVAETAEDSFVCYFSCSVCQNSFADAEGRCPIFLTKTDAVREAESAIEAIGEVKYLESVPVNRKGMIGTFTTGEENTNYSVLDVGNPGQKMNGDYTVEMLIRIANVDKNTKIGDASGAFFGFFCENFTVGYDFATEKWGISPIDGLWTVYAFNPSETGPQSVLADGYFHSVRLECTDSRVSVFVDEVCVFESKSTVREDNRYCIFYPRLCTVEFAGYGLMYNGRWVDRDLSGDRLIAASTWRDRGTGYGNTAVRFDGSILVDSLSAIENAERLYAVLSENERLLITNYGTLTSARERYEYLAEEISAGDVSCDGTVSLADAALLLKRIAGWEVSLNEQLADVNCDGVINLEDASILLKYIAGWDVSLGA